MQRAVGRSASRFATKRQRDLRNLIKHGARALLAVPSVLAWLANTSALAELQVDQTLETTGPWTIGYNSSLKGCVASARSDDGTAIWIGFEGSEAETPAYLAFTNPSWRSIEARKFYELEIQASGSYRWKGYSSGVERPNEKGLFVFGVKRRALQNFAQASGLVLSVNKEPLAQASISGLSDAIEKLMYCQEHRLVALKNPGMRNLRPVADTAKQPAQETPEPASAPAQMPESPAQTIGRVGIATIEGEASTQVAAEPAKANEQAASDRPAQQVAAVPSPAEPAAAEAAHKGDALVRAIKQELKRVGCYNGLIDNDWQAAPARASIQKFARLAGLTIALAEPTNVLLDAVKLRTERVCPPEPAAFPVKRNVRHIARKCPGGFERDEDGDCPPRRRATTRHEIDDEDRPRARSQESRRRSRLYSD